MKTLYVFFALVTALMLCSEAHSGSEDFEKGLRHYKKKNYRNAERYFKIYVSSIPDPAAYYLLGYTDYKLRKYDEANRYFADAYLIDPNISAEAAHFVKRGKER
jgi:TolA-binding protein